MGEYQEEVLINLLDLQAELRGDEPEQGDADVVGAPEMSADADPLVEETLAVTDGSLTVSVPGPADDSAVHARLAALNDRLAKLESHLAGVTERIERIEPSPEMHATGSPDTDGEVASGSFLDLQKIVADRLDSR
ncbi:MAG TPA: hypothetical protein VFW51_01465 [Actinomycetota bacterium]|nr:hypothetical protein [Actinomycetota bacterium]